MAAILILYHLCQQTLKKITYITSIIPTSLIYVMLFLWCLISQLTCCFWYAVCDCIFDSNNTNPENKTSHSYSIMESGFIHQLGCWGRQKKKLALEINNLWFNNADSCLLPTRLKFFNEMLWSYKIFLMVLNKFFCIIGIWYFSDWKCCPTSVHINILIYAPSVSLVGR